MRLRHLVPFLIALALVAGRTSADIPPWLIGGGSNLDLDEMAALLVLPIITGGHADQTPWKISEDQVIPTRASAVTLATVTNAKDAPILLKVEMIDGDPAEANGRMDAWRSTSLDCLLTGRETTTFLFKNHGDGASVYVECSAGTFPHFDPNGGARALYTSLDNGVLVLSAADPWSGQVINQDVLFGDAIVIDLDQGQAYSVGAIPFQAGVGFGDGDQVYRFDGQEYAQFPQVLVSNFLAPVDDHVRGELILFTLDGTTGSTPAPRTMISGLVYNDDEQAVDFQYQFDCFDVVPLEALNANFRHSRDMPSLGLGSPVGHFELTAQPVATDNDLHDDLYGDGNDSRVRGVHGWIVQSVLPESRVLDEGGGLLFPGDPGSIYDDLPTPVGGMPGSGAWARPLSQGGNALRPLDGDQPPTLDADERL